MPKAPPDLPRKARQLDRSGMLSAIAKAPDFLVNPTVSRGKKRLANTSSVEKIIFGGMGGSAITGDVIVNWLNDRFRVPFYVVRDRSLPRFADEKTLLLALSYSGNTSETLSLYNQARRRGCEIMAVSSGGRLLELCARQGTPYVVITPSVAPRAALYQMVSASATVLEESRLVPGLRSQIEVAALELSALTDQSGPDSNNSANSALRLAFSLMGRIPIVYALERMSSVALRFKNQLNENSKMHAMYDLLPEAGHNEVEAWQKDGTRIVPIFIRDSKESIWERGVIEGFKRTILGGRVGSRELDVRVGTRSRLGRLLGPILVLDYVSVYLALLRSIDPTPTMMIKKFRESTRSRSHRG